MAMTQMNTRIDDELKRKGDAAFASLGLTPSDVVRAVWEFAAEHDDAPAVIARALSNPLAAAPSLESAYRLSIAEAAGNLVAGYRELRGLPAPDVRETIDYRQLREEAWDEKLAERGLA